MTINKETIREELKNNCWIGENNYRAIRETYTQIFSNVTAHGCYTVIFFDKHENILCGKCAMADFMENHETLISDIYYEGPTIQCEECGKEIESSYGEVENE